MRVFRLPDFRIGAGYTWAVNSRLHQITPWSNDPVCDLAFEHFLLQDHESRELLPLTPTGRGASAATHRVRHGQGNTVFECLHRDVRLESTFFADRDERMKLVHVNVRNEGFAPRRMRAMAFALTDLARLREQILINAARACALIFRTICCGCPMLLRTTSMSRRRRSQRNESPCLTSRQNSVAPARAPSPR